MKKDLYLINTPPDKKEPTRQSNFELLRIIAMFLIVMHHFAVHGGYYGFSSVLLGKNVVSFFAIGGKLGVNLFVLISGYFLVRSKLKLSRILTIVFQTFFYSFAIYLIFVAVGKTKITLEGFFAAFMPLIFREYWFMTAYIIMYLLSPFVNAMLDNIRRKQHAFLILILFVIQTLLMYFTKVSYFSEILWFEFLYIVGAYIRKYSADIFDSLPLMLVVFFLTYGTMAFLKIQYNISEDNINNLLCLFASISLFCAFKNMHIKNNKFINVVASSTLGIYLIHDNNLVRHWLWREFLRVPLAATNIGDYFILFAFVSCIAIFVICSLIDLARKYALEKPLFKAYYKWSDKRKAKKENKQKEEQQNITQTDA